jgi:U2 small nuclear ribonucleoprotein B''
MTAVAPNKTLYVRNLDESIKLPILKQDLQTIFSQFGTVINVVAHKNIRMRGQAFIVFADQLAAEKALGGVQEFPFHGKKMEVHYAKTQSDDTIKRERGEEEFEQHKKQRLQVKGASVFMKGRLLTGIEMKKAAEEAKKARQALPGAATAAAAQRKQSRPAQPAIPSHHLPPNKVLFLQNLPDSTTKEQLVQIYGQFDGFREVRMVPGRKGIAFVEYDMEGQAGLARVNTVKLVLEDRQVSVTFQRKIN